MIAKLGAITNNFLSEVGNLVTMFQGTIVEAAGRARAGKWPLRMTLFFDQTDRVGVGSVPLVAMVSMFLGLTIALLVGTQLEKFGSTRLIPGLIGISFTRELGPLLTGIVLAARVGAAFTAELGTMQVGEEVEAIEAMGIGPLRYLVLPRLAAIFFLLPCLSVISSLAGIAGAMFISHLQFNIGFNSFYISMMTDLYIRDIVGGTIKCFLFGGLIGLIACYKGLTVEGGAAGVGTATTSSVVTAITAVIALDAIFNIIQTRILPT